jgi:Na+-driven multidrug efflux pump
MKIRLSEHFGYRKILRFTLPSILMMIFCSIYGLVDGIFVSNFIYDDGVSFAAINLIMPLLMFFSAVGFMVGSGGSALVSKIMGQGDSKKAKGIFSMLVYFSIALGVAFTVIGCLILEDVSILFGAEGDVLTACLTYGYILIPALTFFLLQNVFQSFLVAAERPDLGLKVMLSAGITNIVLDALFIIVFQWGIVGAAVATAIAQVVGGIVPLVYFIKKRTGPLYIIKPLFERGALLKTCTNGASEFLTNVSLSIVNMLYNFQLMHYYDGTEGVKAYGVINYAGFVFISVLLGFAMGVAPIISYHFGANNKSELKILYGKCMRIIFVLSAALFLSTVALAYPISFIFVGKSPLVFEIALRGFFLYSVVLLVVGVNIFSSAFFTALNDGLTSGILSTLRLLVFPAIVVFTLPLVLDTDGIWLSAGVAEFISLGFSILFLISKRKKFGY